MLIVSFPTAVQGVIIHSNSCIDKMREVLYQLRFCCQQTCFQRQSFPQDSGLLNLSVSRSVRNVIDVAIVFTVLLKKSPTWQWDNDHRVSVVLTWSCHARRELTSLMTQSLPPGCIDTFGTLETPYKALTRTTVHSFNTLKVYQCTCKLCYGVQPRTFIVQPMSVPGLKPQASTEERWDYMPKTTTPLSQDKTSAE